MENCDIFLIIVSNNLFKKMAPSKHTCLVCSKTIRVNSSSIGCYNCKKWFHKNCSNLCDSEFKEYLAEFRNTGKASWKCSECIFEVSIMESAEESDNNDETESTSLSTTSNEIEKNFVKHLAPFKHKMDNLAQSVTGIRAELSKLAEINKNYAQQQKSLERRISNIENQIISVKELNIDPNRLIEELNERKKRESEVVILNVPESNKPVGTDRRQDDIELVTKIIPTRLATSMPDIKLRRLGKPTNGKTRPLLLYTPTPAVAKAILKAKPNKDMNNNIKFKASLTHTQQHHLNVLRLELEELTNNGETNKTIKYINGVPKIINKQYLCA